jgi:Tfp pilus assembly protein PilZ
MKTPRKYTRRTHGSEVTFVVEGVEYRGLSEDIGAGGMFVRTGKLFPVGQEVVLRFRLRNNREKETMLHATIVRVTRDGIGVKFAE